MKDCSTFETLMTEVVSGAADEADRLRLEDHVAGCPACQSEYEARSALIQRISTVERPDPGDAFWDGFYGRLEDRMAEEGLETATAASAGGSGSTSVSGIPAQPSGRSGSLSTLIHHVRRLLAPAPAWSLQLAAAVLLVSIGVAIGRQTPDEHVAERVPGSEPLTEQDATPYDIRQASLERQALDTIGRSRTLLLGVVNFDPALEDPASLDIPTRRAVARRLADDARTLKADLAGSDRRRLSELISDLEIILLQIANLEANADIPEIEILQSSVDRGAIMFKIDVEQMRRTNGFGAPPDPAV